MPYRISRFIISLLLLLAFSLSADAQQYQGNNQNGQRQQQQGTPKEKKPAGPKLQAPLFNGLYVSADLYGLGSRLLGSDFISSQVEVGVNLKNRYMPTVEIGYAKTDTWNENGIHYKTAAPYFRVGVDYNIRFKKLDYEDWLFLGVRYGYTSFKYDVGNAPIVDPTFGTSIDNPNLIDPIWGGSSINFHQNGIQGSMSWYEFVGGIRTQIWKNFFMACTLRLRYRLKSKLADNAQPWYVPGYGKFDSSANGLTYTLTYKFSLGAKKPTVITPVEKQDNTGKRKKIVVRRGGGGKSPFNSK